LLGASEYDWRADRGVLWQPRHPRAVAAQAPAEQPRDPHGRGHPDPLPAQRRPRLHDKKIAEGKTPEEVLRAPVSAVLAKLDAPTRALAASHAARLGLVGDEGR
jgi:hypothetical protein